MAEEAEDYAALPPSQLAARIKALEQKMYQHARHLEAEAPSGVFLFLCPLWKRLSGAACISPKPCRAEAALPQ